MTPRPIKHYALYGHTLSTNVDFDTRLPASQRSSELHYLEYQEAAAEPWADFEETHRWPLKFRDQLELRIWRRGRQLQVDISQVAFYEVTRYGIKCYPRPGALPEELTIFFLGILMALWLELQGTFALHASAVTINEQAVAFLSHSRGGKSTLAASLVGRGCPLLTDDILPVTIEDVDVTGSPGYPQFRLDLEQIAHLTQPSKPLQPVHPLTEKFWMPVGDGGFGSFCSQPQPLGVIYLPERATGDGGEAHVEINALSPRDAVIELLRQAFLARILASLHLVPSRLSKVIHLAQQIPLRRIIYPSGFEHLPRVCDMILDDLTDI